MNYDKSGADTTYPISDASPVDLAYMTTGDKTRVRYANTWYVYEENSYDIEGRISEYKATYAQVSSQQFVTSYLYDTLNRLTEVRYPAAYGMPNNHRKVVVPTYDETSRLKELKVDNQIQMSEILYNPLSQVTKLKTGASLQYSDIEEYSYDAQTGLLANQKVYKTSDQVNPILNLSYSYNRGNSNGTIEGKTGQLTKITNHLDSSKNRTYEFDTLGRLRTAKGGVFPAPGESTPTVERSKWTQNYVY